jgi:hypothetical protein
LILSGHIEANLQRSVDSVLRDRGWVKGVQPRLSGATFVSQNAYSPHSKHLELVHSHGKR